MAFSPTALAAPTKTYVQAVKLSPTIINANSTSTQTFSNVIPTYIGTEYSVVVNCPTLTAGIVLQDPKITATGVLSLTFTNVTGGNITITANTVFNVIVL